MWQQHATMDDMPTPVERGHRQLGGRTDLSVGFMCMFHVSMFRGFVIVATDCCRASSCSLDLRPSREDSTPGGCPTLEASAVGAACFYQEIYHE